MTLLLLQRLKDYQRRLDLSHLRQSSDPMLSEFKVTLPALASSPSALALLPGHSLMSWGSQEPGHADPPHSPSTALTPD